MHEGHDDTMRTMISIVHIVGIVPFVLYGVAAKIRRLTSRRRLLYFATIVPRIPAAKCPGNVQT
jgi:hypothetical protein